MTKVALIADKNTTACFKLAGLKDVYSVKNAEEAEMRVREISEKPDFIIILITERIANQIHTMLEKTIERKYPIIIPIPDVKGQTTLKLDPMIELIKRKTGIEVKLR